MNTVEILSEVKSYKATNDFSIINNLIEKLEKQYLVEKTKKKGGATLLQRTKAIEKILKKNIREALKECFYETINGEKMQVIMCDFVCIALNSKGQVLLNTKGESEENFKAKKVLFTESDVVSEIEFDLQDIKKKITEHKIKNKNLPAKDRITRCVINFGEEYFNAEYLLEALTALGGNVKLYTTNHKYCNYIKSENGYGIILQIMKPKD